ncbi:hypothetical protein [Alkalihalobacillus sp. R86527]|uniref:hypothetical protein n=1 Tax=Alkalihalobacillus sp. R86527 TaxID=3093863 RepID=UPI00366D998B
MWKKISLASKIFFVVTIGIVFIYSKLFIENGRLDFNDRIFLLMVIVVFIFVGVISSINLTSQHGKNITFRSVIGGIVIFLLFIMYRAAVEFL